MVLSFYVPLLEREVWSLIRRVGVFGCLNVAMPAYVRFFFHLRTFIVNRADTRSLSEFFVLQREHIMTGPFVWTDTIIQSLSFPTSPPSRSLSLPHPLIFTIKLFTRVPITLPLNEIILKIITPVDYEVANMKVFFPVWGWTKLTYQKVTSEDICVTFTHMLLFLNYGQPKS